jgi:transcriptional regulator with XRE-family HTH domain
MPNVKKKLSLAVKIKLARKEAGYSQKQFGDVLKLSDKAISSYEVGRATPPLPTLKEISKLTYKPMNYFLNEEPSEELDISMKIQKIERELEEIKQLLKKRAA